MSTVEKANLCEKGQASKNTDKWATKSSSLLPKANETFLKVCIFAATAKKAQNRKMHNWRYENLLYSPSPKVEIAGQ